jgi:2-polyprenyl-3-methyl-5-hydroxy-6-metoxy-1,4-benzoquinol methylase
MRCVETAAREVYETWHSAVDAAESPGTTPWHLLIARYLAPGDVRGQRVLEIGCGRGELAGRLAMMADGPRFLVAADFAQSAVRVGRQRAGGDGRLSWTVASIQDIPAAASTFDTVISCETIEHVPDPRGALREVRRVLRSGGRLLLTTPNYLGPMGLYRAYLRLIGRRYTEGGQPICHLTSLPRTIAWVQRAGLTVRAVDAVGHYLPWPGRPPRELSALDRVRPFRWFALHSIVVAEKR